MELRVLLLGKLLCLGRLSRKLVRVGGGGRGRGPLEKVWRVVHALLLGKNALEAVCLTRIKLRLILEEPLLHRLLHLLSLVKLRLSLGHLSHLLSLLHRALLLAIGKEEVGNGKKRVSHKKPVRQDYTYR